MLNSYITFSKKKPFFPTPATVGICGVSVNIGVTHLCIALSNFLHSRYLVSTAYMEMNASHEIALLNKMEEATLDSKLYFRKKGVDYYPDLTIRKMTELLHRDYEYSILDFGVLTPHTRPEFLHCDKRIVLCNVSPWKTTQFDKFVHKLKKYKVPLEEVKFVNAYGDMIKKNQEQIYKQYGIRVEPAPLLCNPFHITSGCFHFFEQLMKGE